MLLDNFLKIKTQNIFIAIIVVIIKIGIPWLKIQLKIIQNQTQYKVQSMQSADA